ncbi:protein-methionine-sulfoxide reductase heme-binding subunit MsrQ [Yunchengibacter salinarum]|uniref:sulfite oxidase heme-binding subunit YedZ n=1 Tax=Yunchengibacter salinarum TaxID=3133399 RepID=UPI0035B65BF9
MARRLVLSRKAVRFGLKPLLWLGLSAPFVWLVVQWGLAFSGGAHDLGFNPQETSNRFTGDWALRFLLLSLLVSPLARLARQSGLMMVRRLIGLFAFFYVLVHITSYVWLDMLFNWPELWKDILKRLYITVGITAALLLVPLAVTSTTGWVRRLGGRRWQRLHRLIYLIAPLAVLHFIMMRKGFQLEPLIYAAITALLLGWRLARGPARRWLSRRQPVSAP